MKKTILKNSALVLAVAVAITACKKPEAMFTASTLTPMVGEYVVFTDGQDADKGMKKLEYIYDFGDGTQIEGVANPSHAYTMAGVYKVTQQIVKAKNEQKNGNMAVLTTDITVTAAAAAFTASATTLSVGQSVSFTNKTDETKGSPVTYQWVAYDETGDDVLSATDSKNLTWYPVVSGKYKVVLWAFQGKSKTMVETEITVTNGTLGNAPLSTFLSGKFSYTISATGSSCVAAPAPKYSSIILQDGNATFGTVALPANLSGNTENPGFDINIRNADWVEISSANTLNGTLNASTSDGLYKVSAASAAGVTLTKTEKTVCQVNNVDTDVTNVYTIVLTRQ